MNPVEKINGEWVTSISAIRAELRKQGIPTAREITTSGGRVGSFSSSRRKVSVKHIAGIELRRPSFSKDIQVFYTAGWNPDTIHTPEQIEDFKTRAKAIVEDMK